MMILVDPVFNPNFAGQISSATKELEHNNCEVSWCIWR